MIERAVKIEDLIKKGKVLIIYGARRVGKTTILRDFINRCDLRVKFDSGDNIRTRQILNSGDFRLLNEYVEGYDIIAIDEAQEVKDIGKGLKIIVDNNPDIAVIATGSSSFHLAQQTGEPLTGRKRTMMLYPFSQFELLTILNKGELKEKLDDFLIFGSYPEVILAEKREDKIEFLVEMVNSYLLKDILSLENLRGADQIMNLLKLLAFQAGSEVSFNELATNIKLDVKTIIKYIDLLEKGFVIKRLSPFSRNLRSEITKKSKYYFYDNGVRNAIILQFNKMRDRNDIGLLFENFSLIERMKFHSHKRRFLNSWFWRTYGGGEVDLVEEMDGKLSAYEMKWNENAKYKFPGQFLQEYECVKCRIINRSNYFNFVTGQ